MQDMEFTVEHGKLFMLQTRNGKRTAAAAIKIACDLIDEGMKTEEEALLMLDPKQLDALLHPQFDQKALKAATPVASASAASPGAPAARSYSLPRMPSRKAARGKRSFCPAGDLLRIARACIMPRVF